MAALGTITRILLFGVILALSECRPLALIDLTYGFGPKTPRYPLHVPFESKDRRSVPIGNISFQTAEIYGSEHAGTHMDSPYHFNKDKLKLDEVPIELYEGPGVVLDITYKADIETNPDAAVTMDDVEKWEKVNGLIPEGSIVLMHSGWGKYAFNQTQYSGSTPENPIKTHFPGFSEEVCKYLIESRKVRNIGVDTLSLDVGLSESFACHYIVAEVNGVILENVANVEKLPPKGSYIRAYPMKIEGGTGAPTRIIATIDNRPDSPKI